MRERPFSKVANPFIMMITPSTLEVRRQKTTLIVRLNRPDQHNAFNQEMIAELTRLFGSIASEKDLRAVVLTGSGRTFCAGADISMMREAVDFDFQQNLAEGQMIYELMLAVDHCPLPVIGRINGSAIGGGLGLVSCCDVVVAVERAKFALAEVRLGLIPAVISPFVISKIGLSNARELFLTGERFDVYQAKRIGLVHHIAPEGELDEAVSDRIKELYNAAPGAQAEAKRIIRALPNLLESELREFLAEAIARRRISEEGKEGMDAFLNKRLPWWQEDKD